MNEEKSIFDNESETDLTNKKYNDYIYKQISGYQRGGRREGDTLGVGH